MKESVNQFLALVLTACSFLPTLGQELNCRVTINSQQVQVTERRVFDEMEREFTNFMNDRKWSDDRFENQEKIRCMIQITLEGSPDVNRYTAALQAISVRPVYGTNYETTVINFADRDVDFEYTESMPMNFNETSFQSNITSILGFYAYILLAYDYDTFSAKGGEDYYVRAWQVVTAAQTSGFSGWNQFNSVRNRYWWVQNSLDQVMQPFREALYEYHIQGLDIMAEKPEEARANILEAIKKIGQVNDSKPRSILVIGFLDAKADELVRVFSEGDMTIRRQAYELLRNLEPSKADMFSDIIKNN